MRRKVSTFSLKNPYNSMFGHVPHKLDPSSKRSVTLTFAKFSHLTNSLADSEKMYLVRLEKEMLQKRCCGYYVLCQVAWKLVGRRKFRKSGSNSRVWEFRISCFRMYNYFLRRRVQFVRYSTGNTEMQNQLEAAFVGFRLKRISWQPAIVPALMPSPYVVPVCSK